MVFTSGLESSHSIGRSRVNRSELVCGQAKDSGDISSSVCVGQHCHAALANLAVDEPVDEAASDESDK